MRNILFLIVVLALLVGCASQNEPPEGYWLYAPVIAKDYLAPRFSEKKGVGLQYAYCEDLTRVGADWSYSWSPRSFCGGVPMIFRPSELYVSLSGSEKYLLVFNELDRPRWYHTPFEAARAWRIIEGVFPDRLLVGPGISHLGLPWLREFHDTYESLYGREPRWEALAVHCYVDSYDGCRAVVQQVIDWADEWGAEGGVWVTEFAFGLEQSGGMEDATRFVQWMEDHHRIARYAWFTNRTSGEEEWADSWTVLFEYGTGDITSWGRWYSQRGK